MEEPRRFFGKGFGALSDIKEKISRLASPDSKVSPYIRLMRLDKPTGTWLLLIPCWWGVALASDGFPSLWYLFLFAVGAIVMRGAGCTINDIYDRKIDRLVERTKNRPLASGALRLTQAVLFLCGLLLLGLGILLLFNRVTMITGILSLFLVFTYPLMKRITWWPQLFLGLTFNWGVLMGSTAVTGSVRFPHLFAYVAGVLWTLGYDTVYAHQDKRDDAAIGVKSTALLFGDRSMQMISAFYAAMLAFMALTGWAANLGWLYFLGLLAAAVFIAARLYKWNPDDSQSSYRLFQANRDFGLIIFLAIVLGK